MVITVLLQRAESFARRRARLAAAASMCAAALGLAGAALLAGAYYYVAPGLPEAHELRDMRIQTPLNVYSRDGRLIAQFGEIMRTPAAYEAFPPLLIDAFLAAEDEHFFQHPGIDYRGVIRAAINELRTLGGRGIGGSTITQQVARMHFLTRDANYVRKFKEAVLALRIEAEFSKEEILELYLNTYEFGHRSHGVVTAARTYFGKELRELTVAEAALIAGIAQGPSIFNPISSPSGASKRRAYVLRRMHELDMISAAQYTEALETPIESVRHGRRIELDAPYVAEMVRAEMVRRYGPEALTAGYKVTTTVDSRLQRAADRAIRENLIAYDERHGYRGPLGRVDLPVAPPVDDSTLLPMLSDYRDRAGTEVALVLEADAVEARLYVRGRGIQRVGRDAVAWAAAHIDDRRIGPRPRTVSEVLQPGDVVRVRTSGDGAVRLAQLPEVQGALVALDPMDGAVTALAGGFDFHVSNFNRAVQSRRQPGSSFKPFVYSAALEHGFTPASIVNDAPLSMGSAELGSLWKPTNDSGRFYGDTRLREALVRSLNLASVRVVRDTGIANALEHLRAFGFDELALPRNLTVALGAGGASPLDLAGAYAVFANGGFRVEPYFIERIEDGRGNVLYEARPPLACVSCESFCSGCEAACPGCEARAAPRAISPQNAYLITDMLHDAVRRGTGRRASELGRGDLAGKTGTSNDHVDAWFAGYTAEIVATAWVGFDASGRSLGRAAGAQESGSRTALPMWNLFMAEALAGRPERPLEPPPGIVQLRIDPVSGRAASSGTAGTLFEKFYIDHVPARETWPARARPDDEPWGVAEPLPASRSIF